MVSNDAAVPYRQIRMPVFLQGYQRLNFQPEMITHEMCMLAEGLGAGLSFNKVACSL